MASTKIRKEQISSGAADDGDVFTADGAGNTDWEAAPGGSGTPGDTVADETTWGIAPNAGASTDYSRADHTHGTPADPGGGGTDIGCSVYTHADQTINDNTWTHVHWELEKYDTDTMHDNSTNPERITFNTAGKYLVVAQVEMYNYTGAIAMKIMSGATGNVEQAYTDITYANGAPFISLSVIISAAEDDYMEVQVWQNSGSGKTVVGTWGNERCFCQVQKIG